MTKEEAIAYGEECLSWNKFSKDMKMYQFIEMAIKALSQEPCDDKRLFIKIYADYEPSVVAEKVYQICDEDEFPEVVSQLNAYLEPCDDAVSRDFQIGDEVRIIGSDPIYDDCDVGWVIRNASEKVKTMYVMRNDGSAGEEAKAEWYKTGRHNAVLAEVIKALPSVTQKSGKWIDREEYDADRWKCSECGRTEQYQENFCPNCGADMRGDTE